MQKMYKNFLDFMEWKATKLDTHNLLCSAEFTSRYLETNEKVFSELMENEVVDEWILEPSVKSKKVRIDVIVRVSKKFYKRKVNIDFVEEKIWKYHFRNFEKVRYRYFATNLGSEVVGSVILLSIKFFVQLLAVIRSTHHFVRDKNYELYLNNTEYVDGVNDDSWTLLEEVF